MRRRGMILILSSPSGAGKTTLTRMLLQDKAFDLTLSISVTTRPRRSSEVDGIHYHFIDRPRFDQMKGAGELLEFGRGARLLLRHAARAGDAGARRGTRHAVRHRLAGRAAGARDAGGRRRQHLHPAALDERNCAPGLSAAPRIRERRSRSASPIRGARSSAGDNTTTSSSTTTSSAPTPKSPPSLAPNARKGSAWRRVWRGSSRRC